LEVVHVPLVLYVQQLAAETKFKEKIREKKIEKTIVYLALIGRLLLKKADYFFI